MTYRDYSVPSNKTPEEIEELLQAHKELSATLTDWVDPEEYFAAFPAPYKQGRKTIMRIDLIKLIKILRRGTPVLCPECERGHFLPIGGNAKTTRCFYCNHCNNLVNID